MRKELKSISEILGAEYSSICEMASQCGIDWPEVISRPHEFLSDGPIGTKAKFSKKDLPTLPGYSKKSQMIVEYTQTYLGDKALMIVFNTFKGGGTTLTWVSNGRGIQQYKTPDSSMSELERRQLLSAKLKRDKEYKAKAEAAQAKRKAKQLEQREYRNNRWLATKKAWQSAQPLESHPYLERKGISEITKHLDIRIASEQATKDFEKGWLAYAFYNEKGDYIGLEAISGSGDKKTAYARLTDKGWYKKSYAVIGNLEEAAEVFVCEGMATAASIFLSTKTPCVIARSAGNLENVVTVITKKYPELDVIIAADNDCGLGKNGKKKDGNAGVAVAMRTARKYQCQITVPRQLKEGKSTDWSDIYLAEGKEKTAFELANSTLRLPRANVDFYVELAKHAKSYELPDLVRKIGYQLQAPYKVSIEELAGTLANQINLPLEKIIEELNKSAVAAKVKAKKMCKIAPSSVDEYLRYKTEKDSSGYWTITEEMTNTTLDYLAEGSIVIFQGPMGIGKTKKLILEAITKVRRAAHLLPTVSTVNDAAADLKIAHYKRVDELEAHFTEQIVSCIQSLAANRFLADGNSWFENLDLLCLDEASQMFRQLTQLGKSLRKIQNYNVAVNAINSASSVLITDADANEYLVERLRDIAPNRKIVVIEASHPNEASEKFWDVQFSDCVRSTIAKIVETCRHTKSLIATDNRRQAQQIRELLLEDNPDLDILTIYRNPSKKDHKKIAAFYAARTPEVYINNPDLSAEENEKKAAEVAAKNRERKSKAIQSYDVIIYSPAITSGVSFETEHFDAHFGLFSGIIAPTDALQMMGRDRTAKNWFICLTGSKKATAIDHTETLATMNEKPTSYTRLLYKNQIHEELTRSDVLSTMLNILEIKGHKVSFSTEIKSDSIRKALGKRLADISENISQERIELILDQSDISEQEYREIRKKSLPTNKDEAAITAYKIRNYLCSEVTESSIKFIDNNGLKKISFFEVIIGNDAAIKALDISEKNLDPSAKQYLERKRIFFDRIIEILGLDCNFKGEFNHKQCEKVIQFYREDLQVNNLLFGNLYDPNRPPKCSTTFVSKLLALAGIKLSKRKSNGRIIRFVDLVELERLQTYASSRAEKEKCFIPPKQPNMLAA